MTAHPQNVFCFACNTPLQTEKAAADQDACIHCGKRVLVDDRFREAMTIATAHDGWIEKVFWRENNDGLFSMLKLLVIDLPMTMILYVGPFVSVCSAVLMSEYFGKPALSWQTWILIPMAFGGAYLLLRGLRWATQRLLPGKHFAEVYFIVCSRGLILTSYSKPMLVPWSSIVKYTWHSDVASMSSQIAVSYATAAGEVATVILQGEELHQRLGELAEILDAHFARWRKDTETAS